MVERIESNGIILAIIIYSSFNKSGIEFFTPNDYSQQLGYMNRKAGYKIDPHYHKHVERTLTLTQEVLYIKSGKVKVNLYGTDQEFILEKELSKGDVILLAGGGHGFEILEDAEMIEIKQGPYIDDSDKITFTP